MSKRITLTEIEAEYILKEIDDDLKYHPSSIIERRGLEALRISYNPTYPTLRWRPKMKSKELEALITEKLDEWSYLPGITHEENCGYWGTDDGDGSEYCDCSYKRETESWPKCLSELAQVIFALHTAEVERAVAERSIKLLQDFQPGRHTDPEHLATLMQEEICRLSDLLQPQKGKL